MTPRPAKPAPLFHVVLFQPEIPNNTGNIGRTCVATGCRLHLIHPLGFEVSERACRRAGLDYWPRLDLAEHPSWPAYMAAARPAAAWCFSSKADRTFFEAAFQAGDHLVFGSETRGLPAQILQAFPGRALSLPMIPGERSLNLATAVCTAVYEALRQCVRAGAIRLGPRGEILLPESPIARTRTDPEQ